MFDLVTAVETHFWWPDLPGDMCEIFRVLKLESQFIVIAEVYKGANTMTSWLAEKCAERTGMTLLSAEEHRQLFTNAGLLDVQVINEDNKQVEGASLAGRRRDRLFAQHRRALRCPDASRQRRTAISVLSQRGNATRRRAPRSDYAEYLS